MIRRPPNVDRAASDAENTARVDKAFAAMSGGVPEPAGEENAEDQAEVLLKELEQLLTKGLELLAQLRGAQKPPEAAQEGADTGSPTAQGNV